MEPEQNQRLGRHIVSRTGGEEVRAFVPPPLPPNPSIRLDSLQNLLEQANQSIGRLDGMASVLPDLSLFLYAYVRKEALLSSQIEGTQSSLSDLLLFELDEAPGVPLNDVREVSDYVAALNHGLNRLRSGFPLSLRLIREIHEVLLAKGRDSEKSPGDFRTSQNWIGGTRPGNAIYVPPPPEYVMECMGDLERFLHSESPGLSPLINAGLAHVQFESIHPFPDGNGRLGRLLISLLLCVAGAVREPLLYLSLYLKAHRQQYYELLTKVRIEGAWEQWLEFFLTGVRDTADEAVSAARRILSVVEKDRNAIQSTGKAMASTLRVLHFAQSRPILSTPQIVEALQMTFPTASAAIENLQKLGIIREVTGRQRGRLFVYSAYLDILSEGTEPL